MLATWSKKAQRGLEIALTLIGPLFAVTAIVWAVYRGTHSRFLYFADTTTVAFANFWLAISMMRQVWDATARKPYVPRWMTSVVDRAKPKWRGIAHRFTVLVLISVVAIAVAAPLLRVPLTPAATAIVAVVFACLSLSFETCAGWLATLPLRARRVARAIMVLLVCVAFVPWLVEANSRGLFSGHADVILPQLLTSGPWDWFYPARWFINVLEAVVNGRSFLMQALPILICSSAAVAVYARAQQQSAAVKPIGAKYGDAVECVPQPLPGEELAS